MNKYYLLNSVYYILTFVNKNGESVSGGKFTMITYGVVLRCFAREADLVGSVVLNTWQTVFKFPLKGLHGSMKRVDIMVPTNPDFVDYDCGKTAEELRVQFINDTEWVHVHASNADLFSGVLNEAVRMQIDDGCTHTLIVSPTCNSFITESNLDAIMAPFGEGAKATGLILPDLKQLISDGCLTNTFAMYDNSALAETNSYDEFFDPAVGNPRRVKGRNRYIRVGPGDEDIFPITGIEVPTLVNLIRAFGKSIAPVKPINVGVWQRPDPAIDPTGARREARKMVSKLARHIASAAENGVTLDYIKWGVMEGYPK